MLEHIIRTERATLKYRLLALLVVALGLFFRRGSFNVLPAAGLLLAYMAYIILLGSVILPRLRTTYVVYVMAIMDSLALGTALYLGGGPQGPLFILLPILIVYYSIFLGFRSALFSATTFSLSYTILAWLQRDVVRVVDPSLVAVQIPFLFLVGFLSGYLSQRRLEERREKEELQEFIRVHTHAQSLVETAKALVKTLELGPLLQEIAGHLPLLLGLRYAAVALWDRESRQLVARAFSPNLEKIVSQRGQPLSLAEPGLAITQALEKGAPVGLTSSGPQDSKLPAWALELGVSFLLAVPLQAQGENLGVIYVFDTEAKPTLGEKELQIIQGYGELAAEALANAQFHRTTQSRLYQLAGELQSAIQRLDRLKEARRRPHLQVGDLRLDGIKEKVTVGGKDISLSPTEFELLYVLVENAGQPVNQETLLRRVWGEDYRGQSNVVDVSVHRLRRKLEGDSSVRRIVTVRGRGYMLRETPQAPEKKAKVR